MGPVWGSGSSSDPVWVCGQLGMYVGFKPQKNRASLPHLLSIWDLLAKTSGPLQEGREFLEWVRG